MSDIEFLKTVSFSIPYEEGDKSCYISGNFNCYGDGSIELEKTSNNKWWAGTISLPPGSYEYFYCINQYFKMNERRESIRKPIKLYLKQETFFHDPNSSQFFSRTGGFRIIRCITPPEVKKVSISQRGNRKKRSEFNYTSKSYNIFEFLSKSDSDYTFCDENNRIFGPFSIPDYREAKRFPEVIYQTFPDRFNRIGNRDAELQEWEKLPERDSFYGGNINGIMEKVSYLKELGIDHLYLTPICKSKSNHRYDTDDYFKLDERFGTLEQLIELSDSLKKCNISMILDMVFNHTSIYFPKFKEELNKKLPGNKSWYKFISECDEGMRIRWPVENGKKKALYESFKDYGGMPKLNHRNEEVRNFMLKVMEFYSERINVSYLRYDVADSINLQSIRETLLKFRNKFPEIGHIAEVWCVSDIFFRLGSYTSSINYHLRDLIISLLRKKIGPNKLNSELLKMRFILGEDVFNRMMNIVGSHDTPRIGTVLESKSLSLCAYSLLMIMNGMPSIYYGDELGMEGGPDPDCRRTMEWDKVDSDFHKIFKSVISFRRNNSASYNGIMKFRRRRSGIIEILKYNENQKLEFNLNLGNANIRIKRFKEELTNSKSENIRENIIAPEEFRLIIV